MKREYVTDPNLQRTANALSAALGLGRVAANRVVEKQAKRIVRTGDRIFQFKSHDGKIIQKLFSAKEVADHMQCPISEVLPYLESDRGMKTVTGRFQGTLLNQWEFEDTNK